METTMTHRTTLNLSPAQLDALRRIADRLGYLADRGPTKGSGSVSALVQAIADGEVVLTVPDMPLGYQSMTWDEYKTTESYLEG